MRGPDYHPISNCAESDLLQLLVAPRAMGENKLTGCNAVQSTPQKSLYEICGNFASHLRAREDVRVGRSYLSLLPLLEYPQGYIQQHLVPTLIDAGVPREEGHNVSLRALVVYALTAADISAAWCPHAILWIEGGFPVDEVIANALEDVAKNDRHSQKTRHRAFAIARRWRRKSMG